MKNLLFRKEKMRNQPPSTTTTNPPHSDLITSFAELTSTSIEEAALFLESHNFDLDSAVSNFLVTTATTTNNHPITLFIEITSSSIEEATFFLESQNFDLDSAVSTFFEATTTTFPTTNAVNSFASSSAPSFKMVRDSSAYRSRSPSPPPPSSRVGPTGGGGGNSSVYRNAGKKEVTSNSESDDVEDGPEEYYTGAHKSGQLVQDPSKHNDVDSLFEQARRAGAEDGTLDQPEPEVHTISFWTNGFTVNDGPLRRLEDPQNASFLESIRNSECPEELKPVKERAPVQFSLVRKVEDYPIRKQRQAAFVGVGRALGSTTSAEDTTATIPAPTNAAPTPFVGLVVDDTLPSTSIQLRLGDGTRMVSRFNLHHTVSNIRSFIDASRPGGPKAYQLLTTGFPPKQLNDLNQTIQEAGLANSVVIQKL